jgi:hypothetical protein
MLSENRTLQTLNVSGNSLGKMQAGDMVKLKSSGLLSAVAIVFGPGDVKVEGEGVGHVKPSDFEWESQFPSFCAGVAASLSLTEVRYLSSTHLTLPF